MKKIVLFENVTDCSDSITVIGEGNNIIVSAVNYDCVFALSDTEKNMEAENLYRKKIHFYELSEEIKKDFGNIKIENSIVFEKIIDKNQSWNTVLVKKERLELKDVPKNSAVTLKETIEKHWNRSLALHRVRESANS